MTLQEFKQTLKNLDNITFKLADGSEVPNHFHVTEIGQITKRFIDCGGTLRIEEVINFQLWYSTDTNHRLKADKLITIVELAEKELRLGNFDVEVEYQTDTIGKYDLGFNTSDFILLPKKTACLAESACGIPDTKPKIKLSNLNENVDSCCSPESNCC